MAKRHCVKQVKRRVKGHWRKVCKKFAKGRGKRK